MKENRGKSVQNLADITRANLAEVTGTNLAGVTSSEVKNKKQQ